MPLLERRRRLFLSHRRVTSRSDHQIVAFLFQSLKKVAAHPHIGHDLNVWPSSFELRKPDWKVMITEMLYDPQAKQIYFRRSSDALDDLSV